MHKVEPQAATVFINHVDVWMYEPIVVEKVADRVTVTDTTDMTFTEINEWFESRGWYGRHYQRGPSHYIRYRPYARKAFARKLTMQVAPICFDGDDDVRESSYRI